MRDAGPARELVVISAADPLNLVGILTPHERVPSIASSRVAYLDGRPIAALVASEVRYFVEPSAELLALLDHGRAPQCIAAEAPRRREPRPGGSAGIPCPAQIAKAAIALSALYAPGTQASGGVSPLKDETR